MKIEREVLNPEKWAKRKWEVFAHAADDHGRSTCMKCGASLDWIEWRDSGGCHHEGGRGLGGSKRDDREFVPGVEDQQEKYPFMPESPSGMRRNLFAICSVCHHDEHHQGCSGQLQWSKRDKDADRREGTSTDSLSEVLADVESIIDRPTLWDQSEYGDECAQAEGDHNEAKRGKK